MFKPKDEEPYGINNPKWSKWLQKTFCPCTFGRSCLLLNKGYLSEAGAYTVDAHLGLGVVPPTYVVRLAAPTFHYGSIDRVAAPLRVNFAEHLPAIAGPISSRLGLPLKVGSFQTFVRGYQEAQELLQAIDNQEFAEPTFKMLLNQFQRMAILDYVIRNTDRNHTNWLIKVEAEPKHSSAVCSSVPDPLPPNCLMICVFQLLQLTGFQMRVETIYSPATMIYAIYYEY